MTMEERIALLEEQVQALSIQAQAGEGEGYYTSKYSGEEIDALLEKVAALK